MNVSMYAQDEQYSHLRCMYNNQLLFKAKRLFILNTLLLYP